ncbi:MAG: hypothetical protein JSV78_13090 [Phycisphaerales bacterium]|nr:MAG: hypothetical protein JSV78_13090 [Phycisphaerales bacterium]
MSRVPITFRQLRLFPLLWCAWNTSLPSASADEPAYPLDAPIIFTQLPPKAEGERSCDQGSVGSSWAVPRDYGDGGRIVRLDPDGTVRVLTKEFDSACGADVSFDGKRILFSAKRLREDNWNIWEMEADGGNVRQITRDCGNCRSPAYQATLYTIVSTEPWFQIMFVSDMAGELGDVALRPAFSLYSCKLDGSVVRRLTLNLSDDWDPFLMRDGRVLLSSWQRRDLSREMNGRIALFGVNMDGADYALYCGDQGERFKLMPCETTGGLVVFVESVGLTWDGAGHLACVSTRRPLYTYRSLTNDPGHLFHSPSPLPQGDILVSMRATERPVSLELGPPAGDASPCGGAHNPTHEIHRLDLKSRECSLVFDDPAYHDIHAKLLAPRPQPDGRSSVVNEKYPTGKLYCLDAHLTDPQFIRDMRKGMIHGVRVLEGVPRTAASLAEDMAKLEPLDEIAPSKLFVKNGLPLAQRRILGIVPVEEDGSFNIEVPADVPIELQTLDENGMALRSCGWIWVKHREPRGCIGCHEDAELTPENRFVMAVRKSSIQLTLPAEKRRTVDFRRDVMAILTAKCAGCHNGTIHELALDSSSPEGHYAYDQLVRTKSARQMRGGRVEVGRRYVQPGEARTSPLIWRLMGRNTSRPWDDTYNPDQKLLKHPPPDAPQLTQDEILTIIEWIDMGALWDGIPGPDEFDEESDLTGAGK